MKLTLIAVFSIVYFGMILGSIPGLGLDRAGIALLGAISLVALGAISSNSIWPAVDAPTLLMLFSLMVVSAQFRLSGSYSYLVRRIGALALPPWKLLGLVTLVTGFLSAFLANIIVVEQAAVMGVKVSWREHAVVGIPVTLLSLAFAAVCLWIYAG